MPSGLELVKVREFLECLQIDVLLCIGRYANQKGFLFTDVVPARFNVAVMMFFACWVNYMMRVNMSVNIIAMVPDETTTTS